MAVRLSLTPRHPLLPASYPIPATATQFRRFTVRNCVSDTDVSRKLVLEVKEKLEREYSSLPLGRNGRDDEEMILWFLKDRKFSVEDAVAKLTKTINWRQEFGVDELSEDSVKEIAETGKAFVHEFLDVNDRPVLIVVAAKHLPAVHDPVEDEKLCVFYVEKALSKLPTGKEGILGIVDLRGFSTDNADFRFLTFLFDVFYFYYPKRLAQVLFVEAPSVFRPLWQLAKPLLKSHASLVHCSDLLQYGMEAQLKIIFHTNEKRVVFYFSPLKLNFLIGYAMRYWEIFKCVFKLGGWRYVNSPKILNT